MSDPNEKLRDTIQDIKKRKLVVNYGGATKVFIRMLETILTHEDIDEIRSGIFAIFRKQHGYEIKNAGITIVTLTTEELTEFKYQLGG